MKTELDHPICTADAINVFGLWRKIVPGTARVVDGVLFCRVVLVGDRWIESGTRRIAIGLSVVQVSWKTERDKR